MGCNLADKKKPLTNPVQYDAGRSHEPLDRRHWAAVRTRHAREQPSRVAVARRSRSKAEQASVTNLGRRFRKTHQSQQRQQNSLMESYVVLGRVVIVFFWLVN